MVFQCSLCATGFRCSLPIVTHATQRKSWNRVVLHCVSENAPTLNIGREALAEVETFLARDSIAYMLGALYAIARPSLCLLYWWIRQNAVKVRIIKFSPLWNSHIPLVFAAADFETVLLKIIRIGFDVMSDRRPGFYLHPLGGTCSPPHIWRHPLAIHC